MWACGVVFGHKAVTDFASEHFLLCSADNVNLAALTEASAQHNVDVHLVPFEGNFRCDGVLEGLGKSVGGVEHTPIIDVGDGHGDLFALGLTSWGFDSNTTLPSHPPDGHLSKSLEEGIVETTCVLSANGVGQHCGRRIGCSLTLQPSHVSPEGGQDVAGRRMVHGKPLTSPLVLHRTILFSQVVHDGIGGRSGRVVRDGRAPSGEGVGPGDTRTADAAGQRGTCMRLRHVRPVERANRGAWPSRLGLESLLWHALGWHALGRQALLRHALWRKALLGHALSRQTLLRHALLRHLAVARLHHALLGHALRRKALLRVPLGSALLRETSHRCASHVGLSDRRLPRNTGGTTALTCATFRAKHGVIRNGFSTRCALHGATSSLLRRPAS